MGTLIDRTMRYLVVRTGVAFARSYRRYLQSYDLASDYESFKAKLAIDEQNYRGIARFPIHPSLPEVPLGTPPADNAKARALLSTLSVSGTAWLLASEDALSVAGLSESPQEWEVVGVDRDILGAQTGRVFYGWEVAWFETDVFSASCDSLVAPIWHAPPDDAIPGLGPYRSVLNENLLFATRSDSAAFREFYRRCDWAETEDEDFSLELVAVYGVVTT